MALYGNTGIYAAYNYSSAGGQTIGNNNSHSANGFQAGWSETGQINLEAGAYAIFACYMPSMTSGEYPNNDEDPHELGYKKDGSWVAASMEAPESNPQTHTKTSSALWIESSDSAFSIRLGVRKGGTDQDSGGTAGRLHWRVSKLAEYV